MTKATIKLLDTDNCIRFDFKEFKQNYDVELTINDGQDIQVVSYKTSVHYTKTFDLSNYLVEVVKTDFLVNFNDPDGVFEIFFLQCGEALSRCVFEVSVHNEILELNNHDEILKKWGAIKEKIVEENTGELLENEILKFEHKISNSRLLLSKLKKDSFLHHYFFPVFEIPFHGFELKGKENFSFFNVDYEEKVVLNVENEGKFNKEKQAIITKKINTSEINDLLLPVDLYETEYVFNEFVKIEKIISKFGNNGREYGFVLTPTLSKGKEAETGA